MLQRANACVHRPTVPELFVDHTVQQSTPPTLPSRTPKTQAEGEREFVSELPSKGTAKKRVGRVSSLSLDTDMGETDQTPSRKRAWFGKRRPRPIGNSVISPSGPVTPDAQTVGSRRFGTRIPTPFKVQHSPGRRAIRGINKRGR
ncbi:hypothetical protein KIPB_003928 [Kipferlia bialata]|uniref:Uncharacterized protein n=1 Tax=Kipferlia bialata TaxID=797122 RepID=A0A9K3GHD7_9EUKA|nr:hypothetical protein KIPB_003928 [Kipferlia bialata]|eukprot:g3928.t1